MFRTIIALLSICSISSSLVRIPRRLSLSIDRLVSTNYKIGGFNLHFTADFKTEDNEADTGLVLSFQAPAELTLDAQNLAFILADQVPTWTPPADKLKQAVTDLNSQHTAKIFVAMTEEESKNMVRPAVSKQLKVEFDKQEVQKGIVGKQAFVVCTGRDGSISLSLATDQQTQAKAKIMTVEYKVVPGACAFPASFTASSLQTYFMLLDPSVVVPTATLKQIVELMRTQTSVTFDYTQFESQSVQTHQTFESPKLGVKMALSNGQEINIHVVEIQKDVKQVGGWDISLVVSGNKANTNQVTDKEVKHLVRAASPSIEIHKKDFELIAAQINAMPQTGGHLTQTLTIRQNNIEALKNNMMKFMKKTVENTVENNPQKELNKRLAPSTHMYLLSNFQNLEVAINYLDIGGITTRKYVLTISGKGNNMVNSVVTIEEIKGYLKQSHIDDLNDDTLGELVGQINGERNLKLEVSTSIQDKSQVQSRLEDTDKKIIKIGQYWLNDNDLKLLREQNRNMFNADESGNYYFVHRQTQNIDKDIDFSLFLNQRQHLIDLQAKANSQSSQRESANLAQKTEAADILNQFRQKGFKNFMNIDYGNMATGLLNDDLFREFQTHELTSQTKTANRNFKFIVSYRFIDGKIYIPGEPPMDKAQFLAWKAAHQAQWVEAQKNQWDQIDLKQFEPPETVHHIGSLTLNEEQFVIWRKENANVLLTETDSNHKRIFYFDNKVISEADWPKYIAENQNYEFTEKNGIWSVGLKQKSSGLIMEYEILNGHILIDNKQYTGAEFEVFIAKYRPNFNEQERNFWKDVTMKKIDDSQTVTINNIPYNAAQFRQWRQENRDVLLTLMINNKLVYYYDNQEFDQAAWISYVNQHKDKFELVDNSWQVKRQTKEFRQQKEGMPSLFVISPEGIADLIFKGGKKVEEKITVTFHNEDGICYCNNKPCNWQEFVTFRKNEVPKLSAEDQWKYSQITESEFKKMQQVYQVGNKMMTREEFKEWAKNHPKNANPAKIDGIYNVRTFTFENKEYTTEELDEHFAAHSYKGSTREGNQIKFSMNYNVNFQKDVITLNGQVVTWDVYKKWYDYWLAHGSVDTILKISKYDKAAYERSKNPPPYATYKDQTFATKELFDQYTLANNLNLVPKGDGTWKETTTVTETINIGYQIKDGVITAGGKIMTWEQFDAWRQKNQNYFDISDKARVMRLTIEDVERSKPYEFEGKFYTEEQLKKYIDESSKYTYTVDPVTKKIQIGMKKKTQTVVTRPQVSGTLITFEGQQYTLEQFQQKIMSERLPFRFKQVGQSFQIEDVQSVEIDIRFDGQFFLVNGQSMSAESLTAYLGKRLLPDFRDLYDHYVAFIADSIKKTSVVETETIHTSGSTTNTQSSTAIKQIDFAAMGGISYAGFSSLSNGMKSLYLSGIFSYGTNIQQSQFVSEKNYGTSAHEITIKIDSVDCTFKINNFNMGTYDYVLVTNNQVCSSKLSIGKFTAANGLSCGQQGNKADIADKVGALMTRAKGLGVIKNNAVFDFTKVTGCGISGGSYGNSLFGLRVVMNYEIRVPFGGSTCHFKFVERNSSVSYLENYSSLDNKCKAAVNARRLV